MEAITLHQTEKMCKQCRVVKPVEDFYPIKTVKINPYDVYCIECRKERSRINDHISRNKKRLQRENISSNLCV